MAIFDWNRNGREDEMDKFMNYHLHKESKEINEVKKVSKKDDNELDSETGEKIDET